MHEATQETWRNIRRHVAERQELDGRVPMLAKLGDEILRNNLIPAACKNAYSTAGSRQFCQRERIGLACDRLDVMPAFFQLGANGREKR